MTYVYLGATPRSLATGRPIVQGDELSDQDVLLADEPTRAFLVPPLSSPEFPTISEPEAK